MSGTTRTTSPLDGAGAQGKVNKTDIQAKGSTQTYARRYLKASALDLASPTTGTQSSAARNEDAEPISEDRVKHIRAELECSAPMKPPSANI